MNCYEFIQKYLDIVEVRFPTKLEEMQYEQCLKNRKKISPKEAEELLKRLEKYSKAGSKEKLKFNVRLLVDGDEKVWNVMSVSMRGARRLAIKAAYETGAMTVRILK